jgi:hypothetical protein
MHALLAQGASHLTRLSPATDFSRAAMVHRGQAIKGLNQALAKPGRREYGELDAMLATCYALTFQASYVRDGMADFITMVRGCKLIAEHIQKGKHETAFNLDPMTHVRIMSTRLNDAPALDHALLNSGLLSVQALTPLLQTATDMQFHAAIQSIFCTLQKSSKIGYFNFMAIYGVLSEMSHEQFNVFVDLRNIPSQLLMAHFVCLQMIMVPLTREEWPQRANAGKSKLLLGMVEWGESICQRTPSALKLYTDWPRSLMQAVREEIELLNSGRCRSLKSEILDL